MARDPKYSIIKLILLGIFTLALQVHFIPLIEISVWRPDLVLLLTLFIGYSYGVNQGTLAGFFLGILLMLTIIMITGLLESGQMKLRTLLFI